MTPAVDLRAAGPASRFGTQDAIEPRTAGPALPFSMDHGADGRASTAGSANASVERTGAPALSVRVARTAGEIEALAEAWTSLEQRTVTPAFFQSYAWCAHVLRTLQRAPAGAPIQPFVLTAWRDEALVAVWPLQLRRESGARILTDLTDPFGQYADVLLAADAIEDLEHACRRLLDQARRLSGADALMLRKVRRDTPLGRVLADAGQVLDEPQRAPYVSMAGFPTFETFLATTKAKTRKNVRNATHRLQKLGTVTHRIERRSKHMDAALAHCYDLRSTWLEHRGLTSTAFAHPAFFELVRGLAAPESHAVDVLSMMLMLDDAPISIHYGFLHNRRYYAFMAARDPDYDACSPGKVHLEHVLAACNAHGIETVDLLAPEMAYKHAWASGTVEIVDVGVTWSLRGWLAIDVWRRHMRPLLRKTFLALPGAVRQKVATRLRAPRA